MKLLAALLMFGTLAFADVQVFLFVRTDCPEVNKIAPEMHALAEEFRGRHVAFYLVYPNPDENKRAIENHLKEVPLPGIPLRDPDHQLQERAHATMAPEGAVFDRTGNLKFHGNVHDLKAAINAATGDRIYPTTRAKGCSLADFNHDIAPIIYRHCAPCHRNEEVAPFPLLSYQDVKKRAAQIADVTRRRIMPPWLPEPGHGDFLDEQRLSDQEITAITSWAQGGAPEGIGAVPVPEFADGWQLGQPDLVVQAADSYQVPASGPDVYWNFILAPGVGQTRYVRAVEIRPGLEKQVHHANLYVDRARSAKEGPGMDPVIERTAFDPDDGHFLFWKPGMIVKEEGLSWQLDPGTNLVLNVHIHTSGKTEGLRPSVGLYFTDKKPDKFPLLMQLEHDGALNIPAGVRDFVVGDDFTLPRDAQVLAIYPHAHYLGKLLEGFATLPSGERKDLIRIANWDPAWQSVYRYKTPVQLPKGTVISMRYHYDNSALNVRNPNHPAKRVTAGNQASDEMGHLWLEVLPAGPGDRRLEFEQAILTHRLDKYPHDFAALLHLGTVKLARLNAAGAAPLLEEAVRSDPGSAEAHNFLGSAWESLGRNGEAVGEFRRALELKPNYSNARFNLANALVRSGKVQEAVVEYRRLLEENPGDELTREMLQRVLK